MPISTWILLILPPVVLVILEIVFYTRGEEEA
jgi:hypothetical protein